MVHIKKVKTLHGIKYAVVEPFTSTTKDKNGNMVTITEEFPVEYQTGKGVTAQVLPAIFPVTEEGLKQAKEIQKLFKNKTNDKRSGK